MLMKLTPDDIFVMQKKMRNATANRDFIGKTGANIPEVYKEHLSHKCLNILRGFHSMHWLSTFILIYKACEAHTAIIFLKFASHFVIKIDSINWSFWLCHVCKTVYHIRARKTAAV